MDFGMFMEKDFTIDELIEWSKMYRNIYLEIGELDFAIKADSILKLIHQLKSLEK